MPPRASHVSFFFHPRARSSSSSRLLHVSAPVRAPAQNHYDTFSLPQHATRIEIKKQFPFLFSPSQRYFELSKAHHPDRNRNDPRSLHRFIAISSAYAVLGNDKHREKYDRDLSRRRHHSDSSSPVGARPASGLSRRRTQPHGPPPSFFRNGSTFKGKPTYTGQETLGGFGVGGPTVGRSDDVPHFSYERKYREYEYLQSRWAKRARGRRAEPGAGIVFPLIGVTTILLAVASIAAYSGL
ncbi:hypothetical protein Q9L58_002437 [Maublancomyces gigas]|uniref:J domain-containing protein n=1 Tax=Discina gigas TaxID=1032678 RepID=A0ABR3GSB4_9PEZI